MMDLKFVVGDQVISVYKGELDLIEITHVSSSMLMGKTPNVDGDNWSWDLYGEGFIKKVCDLTDIEKALYL